MSLPADAPGYLNSPPATDDAERWRRMRARFDQLAETVRCARLQTHREATGAKDQSGKWSATGPRQGVGLLAYVGGVPQTELRDRIERAVELAARLNDLFEVGISSAEFANEWGVFCELAGSIELISVSDTNDMHGDRSRLAKGAAQKKWVALQLLELTAEGRSRAEAEAEIVNRVRRILAGGDLDPQFSHAWYRQVITPGGALRPAFTSAGGRLPEGKVAAAARTPFHTPLSPSGD